MGKLGSQPTKLIQVSEDSVAERAGLAVGEQVIVSNIARLSPGVEVVVKIFAVKGHTFNFQSTKMQFPANKQECNNHMVELEVRVLALH